MLGKEFDLAVSDTIVSLTSGDYAKTVSTTKFLNKFTAQHFFVPPQIYPPGLRFFSPQYEHQGRPCVDLLFELPPRHRSVIHDGNSYEIFLPWVNIFVTVTRNDEQWCTIAPNTKLFINTSQIYNPFSNVYVPTPYMVDDHAVIIDHGFYDSVNKSLFKSTGVNFSQVLKAVTAALFDSSRINFDHPDFHKLAEVHSSGFPQVRLLSAQSSLTEKFAAASQFDPLNDKENRFEFDFSFLPSFTVAAVLDSLPCHAIPQTPFNSVAELVDFYIGKG